MRHPKSVARAVAGLTLVLGALLVTAPPASATQQKEIVVSEGHPVTKTFDPIPGQGAATYQVDYPTPKECATPPGQTYCDVIPIRVQLPSDYDDNTDEYITRVVLSWDDPDELNDLDMFIYDLTNTRTGKSNGSDNPEASASADPKFNVVVDNQTGPNPGYTLKVTFVRKRFTPVTEKPSSFGSLESPGTTRPRPPSSDTTPPTFTPYGNAALELPPLDLTDPDFAGGSSGIDLGTELFERSAAPASQTGPARPVSAGVLLAALVGLPAISVGAGGFFFRRRASKLLEF